MSGDGAAAMAVVKDDEGRAICWCCHGTGKMTGTIGGVTSCYPQLPCSQCSGAGVVDLATAIWEKLSDARER